MRRVRSQVPARLTKSEVLTALGVTATVDQLLGIEGPALPLVRVRCEGVRSVPEKAKRTGQLVIVIRRRAAAGIPLAHNLMGPAVRGDSAPCESRVLVKVAQLVEHALGDVVRGEERA